MLEYKKQEGLNQWVSFCCITKKKERDFYERTKFKTGTGN